MCKTCFDAVCMQVEMMNGHKKGSSVASSLATSGPHDAFGVFASAFPQVRALLSQATLPGPGIGVVCWAASHNCSIVKQTSIVVAAHTSTWLPRSTCTSALTEYD